MSNNTIWFVLLLLNYSLIAIAFRYFRHYGLFAWITLASILANIQVIKTIELFGFVTTLGNVMYGTSFLATDILCECYGEDEAKKGVKIGIFSIVATTLIMQVCLWFAPHASDTSSDALNAIFSLLPRIAFASITAYMVSQNFDVWFYNYLKKRFPQHLWLRNNLSTMTSQLLDNTIFTLMAFWGVFEPNVIWQIFATTYVMKWCVALFDTPVIYWARAAHARSQATAAE
ncbi:MAG: putative preQ0 transporter [Candidatus Rifleibacterium amylolyticum]|nr:MAG: putative preQ0 transporter [Candidatus Rifleibacterium amylolyticum]